MDIIKYNDYDSVENAVEKNEPLMAVIAFDSSKAYVCHIDDGVEHHILLSKVGCAASDIDKFYRIIFDKEGADWAFICPPDYRNITYKSRRIKDFYRDGIGAISEFLSEFGYFCDIRIPTRYRRHLDILLDDE